MLANDITLDKQDGTDVVYRLINQDQTGSRRIDITTNLSAPKLLTIRHSTNGKGSDAVDRHLISISQVVAGSLAPRTLTLNFTVAVPRDVAVTSTMVKDAITNLIDFLADGSIASLATMNNVDAILRGES
jgi:hypothetical protein